MVGGEWRVASQGEYIAREKRAKGKGKSGVGYVVAEATTHKAKNWNGARHFAENALGIGSLIKLGG
jgi:hypothetical protein